MAGILLIGKIPQAQQQHLQLRIGLLCRQLIGYTGQPGKGRILGYHILLSIHTNLLGIVTRTCIPVDPNISQL
ncbi:hypothetical protein D3C78_1763430 [compost metagenome]